MGKIRAKELPRMVFQEIVEMTEDADVYEVVVPRKEKWLLLFIKSMEIVIGHREESFAEGDRGFLNVWSFFFGKEVKKEQVYRTVSSKPILKVIGGPFPDGSFTIDKGSKFKEEVRIELGLGFFAGGGFPVNHASFPMVAFIASLLANIIREEQLADLAYWEAFRKPGQKYQAPP